ncbi:hypothetical protein AB0K27_08765 [Micromonospora echinospora]|uniref:Sensor protein n=1 Tax=Micromonospora echinospora TaxID=1877 RepID=A0ABR6MAR1_MICEC|nr:MULTISPECIES: hypothetical protein [Micromonospora]AXO36971.1 hypothetical protein MicB006_4708 [Micromonospora sp. B006]MBB5112466.1 hypothetical protein [Micromonospora echinospora]
MTDSDVHGALAEYQSLRAEIDSRAKFQQQILALQLTLTSAIVAFALSSPGLLPVLLIVPLSSYLLCGRYVGQRTAMRWTTRYINEELAPRVPGGLGWAAWSQANRRPARVLDWFIPLLICFPGAGVLALGWTLWPTFTHRHAGAVVGLGTVWTVGLLATGLSIYLLTGVLRSRPASTESAIDHPADAQSV